MGPPGLADSVNLAAAAHHKPSNAHDSDNPRALDASRALEADPRAATSTTPFVRSPGSVLSHPAEAENAHGRGTGPRAEGVEPRRVHFEVDLGHAAADPLAGDEAASKSL